MSQETRGPLLPRAAPAGGSERRARHPRPGRHPPGRGALVGGRVRQKPLATRHLVGTGVPERGRAARPHAPSAGPHHRFPATFLRLHDRPCPPPVPPHRAKPPDVAVLTDRAGTAAWRSAPSPGKLVLVRDRRRHTRLGRAAVHRTLPHPSVVIRNGALADSRQTRHTTLRGPRSGRPAMALPAPRPGQPGILALADHPNCVGTAMGKTDDASKVGGRRVTVQGPVTRTGLLRASRQVWAGTDVEHGWPAAIRRGQG